MSTEIDKSAYLGLRNLLELILPQIVEHYIHHVMELKCHCPQCKRDVLACALTALPPMYYGSLWASDLEDLRIQWRTLSIENVPSENPKTGRIVALSIIATLRKLTAPLRVGT